MGVRLKFDCTDVEGESVPSCPPGREDTYIDPVISDGTLPDGTLTLRLPDVRGVEARGDERTPRKGREQCTGSTVKVSNCDPTWSGSLTQVPLRRRRWWVGFSPFLSPERILMESVIGKGTIPEDTLTINSSGVTNMSKNGSDEWTHTPGETSVQVLTVVKLYPVQVPLRRLRWWVDPLAVPSGSRVFV